MIAAAARPESFMNVSATASTTRLPSRSTPASRAWVPFSERSFTFTRSASLVTASPPTL